MQLHRISPSTRGQGDRFQRSQSGVFTGRRKHLKLSALRLNLMSRRAHKLAGLQGARNCNWNKSVRLIFRCTVLDKTARIWKAVVWQLRPIHWQIEYRPMTSAHSMRICCLTKIECWLTACREWPLRRGEFEVVNDRWWPIGDPRLKGSSTGPRTAMCPYVAVRGPTYLQNSHASHTWHRHSHQTACFKGSEAPTLWVRFPSPAPLRIRRANCSGARAGYVLLPRCTQQL